MEFRYLPSAPWTYHSSRLMAIVLSVSGNEIRLDRSSLLSGKIDDGTGTGEINRRSASSERERTAFLSRRLTYIRSQETDFQARATSSFSKDERMIGIILPFSSKEEARHLRVCNVNIFL